jgi:Arc/MetJ family transcription regulator
MDKYMISNLEIDNRLIQEALSLTQHQTEKAVVEEALREYIQRRNQIGILELFGTVEYDLDYDYKHQRQKE